MKYLFIFTSFLFLSACSISINHSEQQQDFTTQEIKEIACLGSLNTINGKYVSPNVEQFSPEKQKAYYACMK